MDRFQIAATGVSLGASGLLLALGVGLVCDARVREADAQAQMTRHQRACVNHAAVTERETRARELAYAAQVRQQAAARQPSIATRIARAVGVDESVDTLIREWSDDDAPRASSFQEVSNDAPELAAIRASVLAGDMDKIREAVAQHNARGGEPVFLHDDPELAKRGISVRARWDHRNPNFAVVLEADAPAANEPCTVLVAPGAIVRSGGDGYQDTAPIQARFIHVGPAQKRAEATANICCAQIHSEDPRALPARGLTTHRDPRVARVAATAEREHASWGAAQVAIWAVANEVTENEVASAPGSYCSYIDPAREVLEKAGIDTNKLPLYANASPRPRRGALDLDLLGRLRSGG